MSVLINETTSALLEAGSMCWGTPATASVVHCGSTPDAVASFLILPSADRPRLLVPAGSPAAAAESVRRFSQALSIRERIVRTALAAGLRSGLLDRVVPDRLVVTSAVPVDSLQDHLSALLDEPVVLSLGVGTARANRKPVLEAISRHGHALAFVKLGTTPVTRSLLQAEASALRRLAAHPPAGVQVPRLLAHAEWNGVAFLAQSVLRTPAWRTHRRSAVPVGAIRALTQAFDAGRLSVADSPAWQRFSAGLSSLDPYRAAAFARLVDALEDDLGGMALRHSAWHGDLTPWNLAWAGRQVRVWDWERFAEGVPVGFDLVHYLLALQPLSWPAAVSAVEPVAVRMLPAVGVAPGEAAHVVRWYLLELCHRYLLASVPESGAPLRDRADVLLTHLHDVVFPGSSLDLPTWSSL